MTAKNDSNKKRFTNSARLGGKRVLMVGL